jgi:hypothetical protein
MAFWRHIRLPSQADPRLFRQFHGEVRRILLLLRTRLNKGTKEGPGHKVPHALHPHLPLLATTL